MYIWENNPIYQIHQIFCINSMGPSQDKTISFCLEQIDWETKEMKNGKLCKVLLGCLLVDEHDIVNARAITIFNAFKLTELCTLAKE